MVGAQKRIGKEKQEIVIGGKQLEGQTVQHEEQRRENASRRAE